jgi:putative DNA primase/helicase
MKKNGEQISNDIARLRGTRFVTTTEAEQGKRLSEPLIKQITGNDRMTARFLYGEFFNFVPTFKIFMATNHKPVIKGTDNGIWRRIKLVPFTTRIPGGKTGQTEEKLRGEASGILNWLLESALGGKGWAGGEPEATGPGRRAAGEEAGGVGGPGEAASATGGLAAVAGPPS